MTINLPVDILEAAMSGYQEGVRVYWTKRQEGSVAAISTQEDYGVEAAIQAAFLAAVQLYPTEPARTSAQSESWARRFQRAAYMLAGPKCPDTPPGESPKRMIDLLEIEALALTLESHQDQADCSLQQLIQPAE